MIKIVCREVAPDWVGVLIVVVVMGGGLIVWMKEWMDPFWDFRIKDFKR